MHGMWMRSGSSFGDAGELADAEEPTRNASSRETERLRRGGFGDSEGFGDAGVFDPHGLGRRRSDAR